MPSFLDKLRSIKETLGQKDPRPLTEEEASKLPLESFGEMGMLGKAAKAAETLTTPDESDYPEILPGMKFDPTGMLSALSVSPKLKNISNAVSAAGTFADRARKNPGAVDAILGDMKNFKSNAQTRSRMIGRAEADLAGIEKRKLLEPGSLEVDTTKMHKIIDKAEGRTPTAAEQHSRLLDDFELALHVDKNPDIADHIKQMASTPDGQAWLDKAKGPNGDFPIIRKLLSNK